MGPTQTNGTSQVFRALTEQEFKHIKDQLDAIWKQLDGPPSLRERIARVEVRSLMLCTVIAIVVSVAVKLLA